MTDRLEHLVSVQVRRRPDGVAVVDGDRRLTYQELDYRSNQVANALIAHGLRPDDRVCLLVPKSAQAIVAILGVLKSGAVYIPLDVGSPTPRLTQVLRTCKPSWLIARRESAHLVERCLGDMEPVSMARVCWLGDIPGGFEGRTGLSEKDIDGADGGAALGAASGSNLAYIIFTSGSTAQPKGVPITHDNVVHFVSWANTHFGLGPDDRISCHAPLYFDASVWDVFGALTSGAELHLVSPRVNLLPNLIAGFIRDSRLTQWHSVPAVLTAVANRDVIAHGEFPELRRLICGGEVLPAAALRYWMERLPHVEFVNVYGPTEATVVSSFHTLSSIPADTRERIPIGRAITGTQLAILDSDQRLAKVDEIGDLYIGGTGLSPGYWRDPDRTAAAFYEVPPRSGRRWYRTGDLARVDAAGIFHFHGRVDRQIKTRGYRIELDEITAALSQLSGLAENAVIAIPVEGFEGTRICAAYVTVPGVERHPAGLRAELAASLPAYMLPRRWLAFDSLPKNASGKIDHRMLEQWFLEKERDDARI